MRPKTELTLQNMPSENEDLFVPFGCHKKTAHTLQNMSFENRDLHTLFC